MKSSTRVALLVAIVGALGILGIARSGATEPLLPRATGETVTGLWEGVLRDRSIDEMTVVCMDLSTPSPKYDGIRRRMHRRRLC